ncbi:hypothetical protein GQ44DRAFT_610999 [Phaeosphaeriaceae sp. PMI808]|nr:hypothetical protein GQ44DRAFT_610999 [Phaeosphaeriaceae sp. PMI808]
MAGTTFFVVLFALLNFTNASPLTTAAATCNAPAADVCAQFINADGSVSQDIRIEDGGCTEVKNSSLVAGIRVFDCWCGLWNAQSTGACNNGNDEVVDRIETCTGLVQRSGRWNLPPTHVSCFRV